MLPGLTSAIMAGGGGWTLVGYKSQTITASTSTTTSISLSSGLTGGVASGVSVGDLVIGFFGVGSGAGSDPSLSITDGTTEYTLIGSELYSGEGSNGSNANLRVAYKFMTDPVDANIVFGGTGSTSNGGCAGIVVLRGIAASPLDVAVTTSSGVNGSEPDPAAITPVTAGALILVAGVGAGQTNSDLFTFPAGDVTQWINVVSDAATNDPTLGVCAKTDWTSGAFNPGAWAHADTSTFHGNVSMSIALRPA